MKKKNCHDFHGFKWKNINIYQILIIFLYSLMPFLAHWIVTIPIMAYNVAYLIEFVA
jgi:hypothetical protein